MSGLRKSEPPRATSKDAGGLLSHSGEIKREMEGEGLVLDQLLFPSGCSSPPKLMSKLKPQSHMLEAFGDGTLDSD